FEKWIHEVRHYCPKVPIVLVGTQSDLRTDINVLIELAEYKEEPVSVQQAKHLAAKIGAVSYIECSAMTQRNLKEVFDTALMAALRTPKFDSINNGMGPQGKSNCDVKHQKCSSSQKRRKKGLKKLWCFS
ncbi:unnamed protein product, partial [Larinioides sclopetarius]